MRETLNSQIVVIAKFSHCIVYCIHILYSYIVFIYILDNLSAASFAEYTLNLKINEKQLAIVFEQTSF